MNKTLMWVLAGALAAAGLAVAFMQFGPRAEPAAQAATAASVAGDAKGGGADALRVEAQAEEPAPTPAQALSETPTVDRLIQDSATYEGATVSLSGTILTQCTAGCEFALADDTGVLSVQLEGKGKDRLIPLGKVGKKIAVQGVFHALPRPQIVIEDPNGWQFVK